MRTYGYVELGNQHGLQLVATIPEPCVAKDLTADTYGNIFWQYSCHEDPSMGKSHSVQTLPGMTPYWQLVDNPIISNEEDQRLFGVFNSKDYGMKDL